jgi:hypothetical protein
MRYMLSVQNDESAPLPTGADWDASLARVGLVNEEMQAQGVWVFAGGLRAASDSAKVVRVQDGATTLTDGPFAETKEQLGGFWVIEVDDLDAALTWAEKAAAACWGPIEVRPFDDLSQA